MDREEVIEVIVNDYKCGNRSATSDYCSMTNCEECPFDFDVCVDELNNVLIERLLKAEESKREVKKMSAWNTWDTKTISSSPYVGGMVGWICPICGRALSPYMMQCPCYEEKKIVVTKTGTETR